MTIKRLFALIQNWLRDPFSQKKLKAEYEAQEARKEVDAFIDQVLLPDMLARGFGFGRSATAEYFRRVGVRSFSELLRLDPSVIDALAEAKGIGPKVFRGFLGYLAALQAHRDYILGPDPSSAKACEAQDGRD